MLRNASNSSSPGNSLSLSSRHPYRSPVQHRHQCIFQNISTVRPRGGLQRAKYRACPANWDARGKVQERPGLQVLDSPVRALPESTPAAPPAGRTAKAKPALQLSNSPFRPVSSFPPQKACHAVTGLASAHFLSCPPSSTHAAYPLPFSPILRDSNPTYNPAAQIRCSNQTRLRTTASRTARLSSAPTAVARTIDDSVTQGGSGDDSTAITSSLNPSSHAARDALVSQRRKLAHIPR